MAQALVRGYGLRANLLKHEIWETTVLGRMDDDESEQNPNIQVTVLIPW